MRPVTTLPTLLLSGLVLAACGGAEQETAEPAEMAAPESAETATTETSQLECYLAQGTLSEARERPSPLESVEFSVGGNDGLLCYGAPSARDREIFGATGEALETYGETWRVGANEATAIHLSGPATIGDVALEPGSYSLYAIPGQDEWEFFINSNAERWGIPIDESVRAADIGSFTVEPETMDEHVETMRFRFEPSEDGTMGDMVMEWENTRVRFHVHPAM